MAGEVRWGTKFEVSWTDEMTSTQWRLLTAEIRRIEELKDALYPPGKRFRSGYDAAAFRDLQASGELYPGRPPTPGELQQQLNSAPESLVDRIEDRVVRRLEAAPEAFAIPLVPLLRAQGTNALSHEIESLSRDRDAYLLRYFLWGQLGRGQSFRRVDVRVGLPKRGRYTIYSMWPETEQRVEAAASARVDVGVDPSLRLGIPKVSLAPGVEVGGGFHADVEGRFLIFKEWKRLKATIQAKGIAGRAAEWWLDKPKRFIGNVEFLLVVLTPKGLRRLTLQVEGKYSVKDSFWRAPVDVAFKQTARASFGRPPPESDALDRG